MSFAHKDIERAIHKSQHCQRNWDLSRQIPPEDVDLLMTALTQCPSKQNIAFYQAYVITNREIIEKIHDCTDGFTINYEPHQTTTNTQVLANMLIVFEERDVPLETSRDRHRNEHTWEMAESTTVSEDTTHYLNRDKHLAIGVAAGYLNLTAGLLGYATGCCSCFSYPQVQAILGLKNACPLMMGIGFGDPNLGRRVHHLSKDFLFPAKTKQPIQVSYIS